MILDGYWKKELIKNAKELRFWCKFSKIYPHYAEHQVNKNILYSAIIIRKMFEDEKGFENYIKKKKHSTTMLRLMEYKASVMVYPFSGDKDFIIECVVPDNYDLKNIKTIEIELNKLCNQIIHSNVWSVAYAQENNKIKGVLFASDKEKANALYLIKTEEFIKAIEFCIENGII